MRPFSFFGFLYAAFLSWLRLLEARGWGVQRLYDLLNEASGGKQHKIKRVSSPLQIPACCCIPSRGSTLPPVVRRNTSMRNIPCFAGERKSSILFSYPCL